MDNPEALVDLKKLNKISTLVSTFLSIIIVILAFVYFYSHFGPYNDMPGLFSLLYFPFAVFGSIFLLNTVFYLILLLLNIPSFKSKFASFNVLNGIVFLVTVLLLLMLLYFYFGGILIGISIIVSLGFMIVSFVYAPIVFKLSSSNSLVVISTCFVLLMLLFVAGIYSNFSRNKLVQSLVNKYNGVNRIYHVSSYTNCQSTDIYTTDNNFFPVTNNISIYKYSTLSQTSDIIKVKSSSNYVGSVPNNIKDSDIQKIALQKASETKSNIVLGRVLEEVNSISISKSSFYSLDRSITSYLILTYSTSRCFFL